MTLRFPSVGTTEESAWQERVIAHLGLDEWERVELQDELDFLGPTARSGLNAHGQLWPPNAHFHAPIFQRARGGSALTGFDGDGLFTGWRWQTAASVLRRDARVSLRSALPLGLALAPRWVRRAVIGRRRRGFVSWLRPAANREYARGLACEAADQPRDFALWLEQYWSTRFLRIPIHSLSLLAADHDVHVVHPFADPQFLAALADLTGRAGLGDRTAAMRRLFSDLLPDEMLARPRKAEFGGAFWGEESRNFAAQWAGEGVDGDLVDHDALHAEWSKPNPHFGTATLIQGAWLATQTAAAGSARSARPSPSADG